MYIISFQDKFGYSESYEYSDKEKATKNARILAEKGYEVSVYKKISVVKRQTPVVEETVVE